jgi:chaperonin cofactor prefoldin
MIENHPRSGKRFWARIAIGALLLLPSQRAALANYKIHLKGGKVVEAKSKPVSMEGTLHFTAVDGSFQTLPVSVVDLEQTEKLNPASSGKQTAVKVLTNDDLSLKSEGHLNTSGAPTAKTPERQGQDKSTSKGAITSKEQKRGEAYWRLRSKQIRDQIVAVDNEIEKLDENAKSGKADGIQIGYGTYTQYLLANFEDQKKKLEKNKHDLEGQMRSLEEEARLAGAMPGWLR